MINVMDIKPCKRGHVAERNSEGKCRDCVRQRNRAYYAVAALDPAYVKLRRAQETERRNDPATKEADRVRRQLRRADPVKRARERELDQASRVKPERKKRESEYASSIRKIPERAVQLRRNWLRKAYNITPDDYNALLEAQGGHCALCPATRHSVKCGRPLGIDHDHGSKHIRGLLCHACNVTLGLQGDTLDTFMLSPFCTPLVMQYLIGPADRTFAGLVSWYRAGGPHQPRRLNLVHGEMSTAA